MRGTSPTVSPVAGLTTGNAAVVGIDPGATDVRLAAQQLTLDGRHTTIMKRAVQAQFVRFDDVRSFTLAAVRPAVRCSARARC